MKDYKLIEKATGNNQPIIYHVIGNNERKGIVQVQSYLTANQPFFLGTGIVENNRGWRFQTAILTGEFTDVFLPRARFKKEVLNDNEKHRDYGIMTNNASGGGFSK